MPSSVKIFSKDQWRFSAPREGVTLMSVIFMVSLSLADIESATSDVQKSLTPISAFYGQNRLR